jgi:ankyrin repeat protein
MKIISILFFWILMSNSTALLAQPGSDAFEVARKGTVLQAKELFKSNPKAFRTVNENGFSPLILACYRGNNEVAKFMIESGVDINVVSDMGTALMACIVKGNNEMATFLIQQKANLNLTDNQGTTALMYAVQFKNIAVLKSLLDHKANKTLIDNKGKTAFEYAVFSAHEEIINLLK